MIVIDINAALLWSVLGGIGGVATVFSTIYTVLKNKQKKREDLMRICNELCNAISISEINSLLNYINTICDKGMDNASSIIEVQKELKKIVNGVNTKWNELKLKLKSNKRHEFLEKLEDVYHEYKSCVRDVETIVFAIECNSIDEIRSFLSGDNSQEMHDIVNIIGNRYENDLQGFVKQIVSLRFNDLEIPDFASRIRYVLDTFDEDENTLYTRLRAVMGSPEAQNALGEYYYYDQKQLKKAFSWFKKSAEQGFARAQYNLSVCYSNGDGVEKDEKEAFEWCKKSAEQGDAQAQMQLGVFYENGSVVEKDEKEAFEWCKKSAEQGFAEAQYFLGQFYRYGIGVMPNEKKAFKWYKKSAEQGFAHAQHSLGVCYFFGMGVEKNDVKAFVWYKKSAELGVADAQYNLSVCYRDGIAVEKDIKKTIEWLKKAAEQDFTMAQYNLSIYYKEGKVVEKNEKTAFELMKKAAEKGFAAAQNILGDFYDIGIGCDQDFNRAYYWYCKVSESKDDIETYRKAMYSIGRMYFIGEIGFGDKFTALSFFKIAAQYGHAFAQYMLGYCYENGIGVKEVDIAEAKYWYGEAAKQGGANAIESLKRLEKSE